MSQSGQTHSHCWSDAPRAGLGVPQPEGVVVPGNRRVKLQLMPLLLQGRKDEAGILLALFTAAAVVLACGG